MKLSEAMRKGCEVTGPIRGSVFHLKIDGGLDACALGAVYVGYLGKEGVMSAEADFCLANLFASGEEPLVVSPMNEHDRDRLGIIITALNDHHWWSREEIADWLEEIGY